MSNTLQVTNFFGQTVNKCNSIKALHRRLDLKTQFHYYSSKSPLINRGVTRIQKKRKKEKNAEKENYNFMPLAMAWFFFKQVVS